MLFFWVISKTCYFLIGLKLGKTFTRPSGLDIIQGMESPSSLPFINTVARFEGKIDMEKFCRKFHEQIIKLKDKNGKLRYKKFTQTYEKIYGYHVFRDVKDFDIRNQIKKVQIKDIFPEKFSSGNNISCQEKENTHEFCENLSLMKKEDSNEDGHHLSGHEEIPNIEWEALVERAMEKFGARPIPPGYPKWEILLIEEQHQ